MRRSSRRRCAQAHSSAADNDAARRAGDQDGARVAPAARKPRAPRAGGGPTRAAEAALWARGFKAVAGVDEAGRGPLAGPVVAAAAVLPPDAEFPGLNDSKQLGEEAREALYAALTSHPGVAWSVAVVDHETIDEINILQATMLAMQRAVQGLPSPPDHLLIDGNRKPTGLGEMPAQLLVKGDATSTAIAAASVIAKVTRDRLMLDLDAAHPGYGFAQHKGYGVPAHKAAIAALGPCPVHRRSFEPVKSMVGFAGYGQKARAAAEAAAAAAVAAGAAGAQQPAAAVEQQQQQQEQEQQKRRGAARAKRRGGDPAAGGKRGRKRRA
ncbi:rnhB [Scenedesmus sp. PABB004]|nr:rnhB [Scenedesmus sp. PABB004]